MMAGAEHGAVVAQVELSGLGCSQFSELMPLGELISAGTLIMPVISFTSTSCATE